MSQIDKLFSDSGDLSGAEVEAAPAEEEASADTTAPRTKRARGLARRTRERVWDRRSARKRLAEDEAKVVGDPDYTGPIIELNDVTRFFPGPPPVNALRGINLTVERGDYLAIVGPSGSGKSTMLNTLGLLDRPSTGRFMFEGLDVADLSDDERSAVRGRAVGFVFQSFHLMPTRTVLENVMLAGTYAGLTREEREPLARAALDRVGLSHRVDFSPNTLSGGERQRVAIARAVCTSPRLLLADEPTGNLDRENSASIMKLFRELGADGLTIVMITHDSTVAESADRRVRINDGELSEIM